jgi:UDP:flavonoid glycosyltransferase YjiC (YdhE family)
LDNKKKILVAFLDWGLGHATRCMPIIDKLLQQNYEVVIAGNGRSLLMVRQQYPKLKSYELPDYNIQYSGKKNAAWQILFQARKIYNAVKQENIFLKKIIEQEKISIIISDNRYGIYHPQCKNIFLGHQIAIQPPQSFHFMKPFLLKQILKLISKFDELWIPDVEDAVHNLSGELSHNIKFPIQVKYIGILSRFQQNTTSSFIGNEQYRIVAMISGVEPSRTVFEQQLLKELEKTGENCLLVCGKVEPEKKTIIQKNITVVNYLQGDALLYYLQQAEIIICRSGYSTIMDLAVLGKKAILIPTPGQTEQEYLAENLAKQKIAISQKQSAMDLKRAIAETAFCVHNWLPAVGNLDTLIAEIYH